MMGKAGANWRSLALCLVVGVTLSACGGSGNTVIPPPTSSNGSGGSGNGQIGSTPRVVSTVPASNSQGVAVNVDISVSFSEEMDAATITTDTFKVSGPSGAVSGTVTVSADGKTATFKPVLMLAPVTSYQATLTNGVKDRSGGALTTFTWNFTTGTAGDTTPPTIRGTAPADNASDVATTAKIAVTFSEPVDPASVTTTTFSVARGPVAVAGKVTLNGAVAVFVPDAPLQANTTYTVTVTTGVKDLAGNNLTTNATWHFTTGTGSDTLAPTVISTVPADGATGISLVTPSITVTFSEAMDPSTINQQTFTLTFGGTPGVPVIGTIVVNGSVAGFTPVGPLQANTTFTATVTTGAKDLTGNPLAQDLTWSFTTGAN